MPRVSAGQTAEPTRFKRTLNYWLFPLTLPHNDDHARV